MLSQGIELGYKKTTLSFSKDTLNTIKNWMTISYPKVLAGVLLNLNPDALFDDAFSTPRLGAFTATLSKQTISYLKGKALATTLELMPFYITSAMRTAAFLFG